jgi:hypothetical protein
LKEVWIIEVEDDFNRDTLVGIYDSEEKANCVAEFVRKPNTVSKWPINPGYAEASQGLQQYLVWILIDGTVKKCQLNENMTYDLEGAWKSTSFPGRLDAHVWAKNEDEAISLVNKYRQQILDSGEWDLPKSSPL